jgi:hypothetical protein
MMKKSPLSWTIVLAVIGFACQADVPTGVPFNETPLFESGSGSDGSGSGVTLRVSKAGTGTGRVTSSPSGIDCGSSCSKTFSAGTVITLAAQPSSGSAFAGWSGGGCSGTGSCTLTLNSSTTVTATFNTSGGTSGGTALTITTTSLPNGNRGADYSAFISSSGGSGGQDKFSLVSGSLPSGLKMEQFFGVQSTVVHGVPTQEQTSTFTVRVEDESGSATRTFSITIDPPSTLVVTLPGATAKSGTLGTFYFQNLFASGGSPPYTWSVTAGQLPPGLRVIKASNGNRIEGTPTARGTFTFTLTVTDSFGARASQQTSITIS